MWVHCPRASSGLLPRRSDLVGYVQRDARFDQVLLVKQSFPTALQVAILEPRFGNAFPLRHNRCMSKAGESKHPLIALDLFARPQRLLKVIGKFHCWLAIGIIELAHQTQRVKVVTALSIAVAEIIGQHRAPTRTKPDAAIVKPFFFIEQVYLFVEIFEQSVLPVRLVHMYMKST